MEKQQGKLMKIYQVGGSVRDMLLGRVCEDLDWLVVGSSPEEMLRLGFVQVGADFPVFLQPVTGDEYALARTERKTEVGYLGFAVNVEDVTLEDDLMRRDLTINAMAMCPDGTIIDPYGGQTDLRNKVLRHVGPAFAEDPVRILRVLRFLARFGQGWTIAPETKALIVKMVQDGEASALVPERIWKETSRALMEPYPELFIEGLDQFGLSKLPCFEPYRFIGFSSPLLKRAVARGLSFEVKASFAFAPVSGSNAFPPGMPPEARKAVIAWAEYSTSKILSNPDENPALTVDFLERTGAFKSQDTLQTLFSCWECLDRNTTQLRRACDRVLAVDIKSIAAALPPGPAVGRAIRASRQAAVSQPFFTA